MKAMVLSRTSYLKENPAPLTLEDRPKPVPGDGETLIKVAVCGVCHTELDEIEGRTAPPRLPVILGHQVVGRIEGRGPGASRFPVGARVGVAWIYSSCGACKFCRAGLENLCPDFKATGRDADGGYAEYMKVREDYAIPIPDVLPDESASPLLCAGTIGWRSFRLTGLADGARLGLGGFGASASLVIAMVRRVQPRTRIFVFSRNEGERAFARELGAVWAGDFHEAPPDKLDAIIDTTPVWKPVIQELGHLDAGGRLVINAIRKQDDDKPELLRLDYAEHLWMEKETKSVANVTRKDVADCLAIAAEIPLKPEVQVYPLADANRALLEIKAGKIRGAKVLRIAA